MSEFCVGDLQFSLSSDNLLGSGSNGKVFKGTFKGDPVAVKKLSLNCTDISQDEHHWEKLIKLKDEHLVQYRQCVLQDNVRYLVMDVCQGSMLDYCRKTLDVDVASHVKATDVMWQIICGVDFLQRQKIDHRNLKLENVLFWKKNPKSRRVVVKLAGYGYSYHKCEDKIGITRQLGYMFYSAATKEEAKPNGSISLHSLTEMDVNHKTLALDLINLLIDGSLSNSFEVGALLRHPLFTRYSEDEGRSRLMQDSMDDKVGLLWNDKVKMRKWLESVDEEKFPDEDFGDFKITLLESEIKDKLKILSEAFKTTPQLFSEYIWHVAIESGEMPTVPRGYNKTHSIEIQEELGKGTYGKVYRCEYTDRNGKTYPAACKKCNPKSEAKKVFIREIETLRKLDHLFVVKYINVVEKDSQKFIVMELCEGSLKDYVEGKLEGIPKDSLDEKILIGQVALGLAYIHSEGIIHKDLKLENILLKLHSPRLFLAKIADFGFAKELKPGKSEFSETAHPGTDTYMAPELLNAKEGAYPASFASDVYALGITIARIVLKGEHPFSSNKTWRNISMVKGLVPPNLEGLSWDLIDLILKLTEKDPGKRPEMVLVLRHPYFVLTNEKTKRHFVDQFWTSFRSLNTEENKKRQMNKIFNHHNFREWYETLSRDKPDTAEEIEQMTKNLKLFSSFLGPDVKADTFDPSKEYEQTIKEAITSEYDANVGNKITKMNGINGIYYQDLSRYRLYQLIQRTPKLLLPYFWSHLQELDNESLPSVASSLGTTENQKFTCRKRRQSSRRKVSIAPQYRHRIISELEWISYYYEDEELNDELWKIKYAGNLENSPETVQEIIQTVAKCNVSERVWSVLLDRLGSEYAEALLFQAVQSYSSNAPRVTDMILQRCNEVIIEENILLVHDALFVAACNEGDWADEIMQLLLKNGGDPNAANEIGYTPAHYAAMNESHLGPKIMKLLLQYGANPNARSIPDGITPLHQVAVNQGNYAAEILKQLLDNGGTCNVVIEKNRMEPIHFAVLNSGDSALELLDLLLEKRGINTLYGKSGMTLLHFAMMNEGDCGPAILKKLIENGMNPNIGDDNKCTPLHLASGSLNLKNQNIAVMKDLLENGGDPNVVDTLGFTSLHYAATDTGEYAYEKLKLLFLYGGSASINAKDGLTPLHCIIFNNGDSGSEKKKSDSDEQSVAMKTSLINRVQLILDNGGDTNAQDNLGRSPVHAAVIQNNFSDGLANLQMLLKNGGNPNLIDKEKCTPIHYAAISASERAPEQMKILLENGGDTNISGNKEGLTPLHLAVVNLNNMGNHGLKLTEILLEHGGDPNAQNNFGRSPVHAAVTNTESNVGLAILQLLLKKGGNANLIDTERQCTPIHYVADSDSEIAPEQMKILLENGGDANFSGGVTRNGLTPVHAACLNSGIYGPKLTQILIENGGNPNALDLHKRTPLHLAIQQNKNDKLRLDTIKLLLEKGGNPNARDKEGRTPVHYVIKDKRSNSFKVLKLLLEHGGNILQEDNKGISPHRQATQKGNKQYCHPEVKKHIERTYRKMK